MANHCDKRGIPDFAPFLGFDVLLRNIVPAATQVRSLVLDLRYVSDLTHGWLTIASQSDDITIILHFFEYRCNAHMISME